MPEPANQDTSNHLSPSTVALLALAQDVSALLSLSYEVTASTIHDWWHTTLGKLGKGDAVPYGHGVNRSGGRESGKGLAVVIVGAGEGDLVGAVATGQAMTLHLAKSGYTVFPFIPLPPPSSPASSSALSHLLITWSAIQKRLRARVENHPGAVVPVIVDPENTAGQDDGGDLKTIFWAKTEKGESDACGGFGVEERGGRFSHAGQTVRAYCRENNLTLAAIICASRKRIDQHPPSHQILQSDKAAIHPNLAPTLHPTSLSVTPEDTLISLYRTNVLDPLSVIKELSDLLAACPAPFKLERDGTSLDPVNESRVRGRGRVIFVNGESGVGLSSLDDTESTGGGVQGVSRMIGAARSTAAKLLKDELDRVGIDVCEVVVGPMASKTGSAEHNLGRFGQDSTDSKQEQRLASAHPIIHHTNPNVASRLTILSRLWAVDDALLYSSVRRAIEDRYPRYRHHAGLSVVVNDLTGTLPGGTIIKGVGQWIWRRVVG
nr:hypothetical protein L204_05928 [Cryptococcus depauperatus CBS 7855]